MVHKFFGGVVPEAGAKTQGEAALRASTEAAIAGFGPAFDEMNFSDALKGLWAIVAETDGYLTANAPWKKPAERSEADQVALQARVLATAAEAIRVITALAYPILPEAASKVWRQLGQGDIADASRQAFLTKLAWGGLKAGTLLGEPSPLFPRAEKDAIERMQNLEEENNKSAVEAAGGKGETVAPGPATASPSVSPTAATNPSDAREKESLTPTSAVWRPGKPLETAKVHRSRWSMQAVGLTLRQPLRLQPMPNRRSMQRASPKAFTRT